MNSDEISKAKQAVHDAALKAWVDSGFKGTVESITGIGKTKISLDGVKLLDKSSKIIFLAETVDREYDLRLEQKKWSMTEYEIEFMCYQSAYKLVGQHYDLVIADEIHCGLSLQYSKFFFNNTYDKIMCLSATVDAKAPVDPNSETSITKIEMLNKFAPICYSYTMDDGQTNGTARKLKIYRIRHQLDKVKSNMMAGTKLAQTKMTEYAAYDYYDKKFKQSMFMPDHIRLFAIRNASSGRAKILYDLPSKIVACKKLIKGLKKTRTILFGNSLDALIEITPDVISSRNTDKKNELIRQDFDSKKINLIGSFKKLKQGANLTDVKACIIHSYYSKELDVIQRLGRMRQDGTLGYAFIFVTEDTQEEKWYQKMLENITSFDIVDCDNVDDCLTQFKEDLKLK
jgi:superfamily II DNA or RNA helicase